MEVLSDIVFRKCICNAEICKMLLFILFSTQNEETRIKKKESNLPNVFLTFLVLIHFTISLDSDSYGSKTTNTLVVCNEILRKSYFRVISFLLYVVAVSIPSALRLPNI